MKCVVACTLALGLALLGAVSADARAESSAEPLEADVVATCDVDHAVVREAVEGIYDELGRLHRQRLPGPRGQTVLERRLDELIDRAIDVETFAEHVLRGILERADDEQRGIWLEALERMLRSRYLRGLDEPHRHEMVVERSDVSCDRAEVTLTLSQGRARADREVELDLAFVDGRWRVYNVTLDGVSLVRTWRSRFHRVFVDGGVAAVDRQMRILAARYAPSIERGR